MRGGAYGGCDALGLAELVRRREVTPAELLEEAIARIARVNPRLNAVVTPLYDDARRAIDAGLPDGPLRGVPFLLKDLDADFEGTPMSSGSRFMAGALSPHDATLVARHRRAGLVVVGKTNTPELGLTPYTEPELFGPARNPWNPDRMTGGSSGGAAAAVAAGVVPAAHANDGGGSIRIPASCCGVFGLKPTRGRTPVGPDCSQVWAGMAIGHAVTRSVRDSAALLDATAGPESDVPGSLPPPARPFLSEVGAPPGRLRIALARRTHLVGHPAHVDCAAAADDAAHLARSLGHDVEEQELDVDPEQLARDFFLMVCVEIAAGIERHARQRGRRPRRREIQTTTWMTAEIGRQHSALAMAQARERLDGVARRVARFFERFDVLLSPTLGLPPPPVGALRPRGLEAFMQEVVLSLRLGFLLRLPGIVETTVRRVFAFMPYTPLANVTGAPSMSVPLFWNGDGLPIGAMFTARFGDEATLFRLAAQLEQARPWSQRRPPIHADVDPALASESTQRARSQLVDAIEDGARVHRARVDVQRPG
jgi:amidase